MADKPEPIPANYRRITPSLVVGDAARALLFYNEVFGATERVRFPGPGGKVAHAEIEVGDSVLIVEDESPERGTKAPPAEGLASGGQFTDEIVQVLVVRIAAGLGVQDGYAGVGGPFPVGVEAV